LENSEEKKLYPIHFWDELNNQSPKFRQQFSKYKMYGNTTMDNLLSEEDLKDALVLQASHFETSYIENLGNGTFKMSALPIALQFAPANGMVADDINADGNLDILMVGNDYGNEVFVGRYDAFKGALLLGNGRGNFDVVGVSKSGFSVGGDAKALAKLYHTTGDEIFVATQNRDSLQVFIKNETNERNAEVFAPEVFDSWAEFIYGDGTKSKIEFYYGAGYLTQSSRKVRVPSGVKEIVIYDYSGKSRTVRRTGKS
jgi:enediyne biosynthesis protein E4